MSPVTKKYPKKPWYLKILKSINFVRKKEYKEILRVWGQGMWLHESESNSLIRQACKNKIFLTIIYISYNSRWMILGWSGFKVYPCVLNSAGHNPTKFTLNMELNVRYCLFHIYNYMGTSEIYILMCFIWRIIIKHQNIKFTFQTHVGLWHLQIFMENDYKS